MKKEIEKDNWNEDSYNTKRSKWFKKGYEKGILSNQKDEISWLKDLIKDSEEADNDGEINFDWVDIIQERIEELKQRIKSE